MIIRIRATEPDEATTCEQILRSVPDWFGIEESLLQYVADCARYPTILAEIDGAAAGFVTLRRHFAESAEIHCIAARREHHRGGIGRAMIEHVEGLCRRDGVRFLQVKTLGPSRPCEHHDLTRKFYLRMGFVPLEELIGFWGRNPCLIMIKSL